MSYYENALKMRPYIEKAAASLSNAEALEVPTLFPAWAGGTSYITDERIEYGGTLYRCVQAHTSQADWTPPGYSGSVGDGLPGGVAGLGAAHRGP